MGDDARIYVADQMRIKDGTATDVYFLRTRDILELANAEGVRVVAEAHSYKLPNSWSWAVFTGVEEAAWLLEGVDVNVYSMEEGTLFRAMEPLLAIEGRYYDFVTYESSLLGMLRHYSSVSTKAARIKQKALDKTILFFGIRSVHPAITPMVDRAAYIGGCDAVSGTLGAELLGKKPVGTMPHALILALGDQRRAWKAFDEAMPPDVPRIMLCDTLMDERMEALLAVETLGERLYGVRLDTPSSRRGSMREIVREVRWSLDTVGRRDVKIIVSGGVDEKHIEELRDLVDGFGVGTSIAFPPSIDISLDIVEVDGKPIAKRGKLPGRKQVWRCEEMHDTITSFYKELDKCPACGGGVKPLLTPLIQNGKLMRKTPTADEIRDRVLQQLKRLAELDGFNPEPITLVR